MRPAGSSLLRTPAFVLLAASTLAACPKVEDPPDAPTNDGKLPPAALEVTCPRVPDKEITEVLEGGNYRFSPVDTILKAGQIARFRLGTIHNARSSDGFFTIEYGGVQCIKFNQKRTYEFGCQAHGFRGTVTAQ